MIFTIDPKKKSMIPFLDERFAEEKKESDQAMSTSDRTAPAPPPLSPSKQRAKAAGSAGLSELSKQLRILQAKNEAQSVEINRLERQLRILAELQGISVADLRKALEDACANEAFGELQHRVAKLRAELEAATLAKQKEQSKSMAAPHIANLELRVGELEEVEERHQREIHHLYEELSHERSRATRLEAERDQHKKDAQDYLERLNQATTKANQLESSFQDKLQQHQLEQARKMQELAKMAKQAADSKNAADASADGRARGIDVDTDGKPSSSKLMSSTGEQGSAGAAGKSSAEYELLEMLLKQKTDELRATEERFRDEQEKWIQQLRDKDAEIRAAQTKAQVEHGKMNLTIKELQDNDSQSDLRLAQFKARFTVQDERIGDMEQQLSSLYTAFGIIKEDQDVEDMKRTALQINLKEADEEMARQVDQVENKSQRNLLKSTPTSPQVAPGTPIDPWDTTPQTSRRSFSREDDDIPRTIETQMNITTPASALDTTPATTARRYETPSPSVTAEPYTPNSYTPSSQRTPGTWQLLFPEPGATNTQASTGLAGDGLVIKGVLIVKSKSMMRKWKSKFCKLYRRRNHYQWDMEGKSFTLGCGISKVEFNPNHPLSFIVYCNPFDDMAPVIHAAASNENDYNHWMQALTQVTTGKDYEVHSLEGGPRRPQVASSAGRQISAEASVVSGRSAEEQEAADLERALRLSQTMK